MQAMVSQVPVRFGHWEAKAGDCRQRGKEKVAFLFLSPLPHSPTPPLPTLGDVSGKHHASSAAPAPLDWSAMGLASDSRNQKSRKHERKILKLRNFCPFT